MPTKKILKKIFIASMTINVCLILIIAFSKLKLHYALYEPVGIALLFISFMMNFINGVFYKELYAKGITYKGTSAFFFGISFGVISIFLLILLLIKTKII